PLGRPRHAPDRRPRRGHRAGPRLSRLSLARRSSAGQKVVFGGVMLDMSRQLFDLSGRVALVTGGSKGLGRAMALGFAEAGADVVTASRQGADLEATAAEIRSAAGVKATAIVADMTRRDDVRRLAEEAIAAVGRVDILVNNAGTNQPQPLEEIVDEDWDRLVE